MIFFQVDDGVDGSGTYTDASIEDRWVHLVGVYDGSQTGNANRMKIYQNGVSQTLGFGAYTVPAATANLAGLEQNIGTYGPSEGSFWMNGKIDDLRIYNRSLSVAEIKALALSESYGTPDGMFTLADSMDVNGSITFNNNTLDVSSSSYDMFIAGDWAMIDGSFSARAGSVTFDGGDTLQNITGDTTFYDLWKIDYTNNSTDASLLFEAGSSTRITNTLNLVGIDASDRVRLDSSDGSTEFVLDVAGGDQSVSYVTVSNSNAESNDITATTSWYGSGTDQGAGSPNWIVTFNTCTSITSAGWSTASTWDCGAAPTSSQAVLIDGETVTLTTTAQAEDVTISAGELKLEGYRIEVGGKWNKTGGTFTPGTGTVLFNSTATDETITSDGAAFNDVFLNDGLVGYWKLDEMDISGTVVDSSGYGRHGGYVGSPTPEGNTPDVNFVDERSLSFNGTSDYVSFSDNGFPSGSELKTFAAWFKTTEAFAVNEWRCIAHYGTYAGNQMLTMCVSDSSDADCPGLTAAFSVSQHGDAVCGTSSVNDGLWHHGAVVHFGVDDYNMYVDGVLENNGQMTTAVVKNGIGYIGIGGGTEYFNGSIDEVRIYNRALSAGEVALLAQGGQPGTAAGEYLLADALDVNGDLIITGGTLDTGGKNITVAGSLFNYGGVFEHDNAGSVTLDGAGTGSEIQGGSNYTFFNLVVNNAAGTWSALSDIYVDNSILISAGELDVHASIDAVEFAGTLAVGESGTFTGGSTKLVTHKGDLETTTSATYTATSGFTRITADTDFSASTFTAGSGTVIFSASDTDNDITSNGENLNDVFLGDGLVGYWKLDDTTTTNGAAVVDSSGYGNDGTLTHDGSPSSAGSIQTPGPFRFENNQSIWFDGAGDYVSFGTSAILDFGVDDFSVSAWIRMTSTSANDANIITKDDAADAPRVFWGLKIEQNDHGTNANEPLFVCYNNGSLDLVYSGTALSVTRWYHIVGVRSSLGLMIYVNGNFKASVTNNSLDVTNLGVPTWIGASKDGGGNRYSF